MSDLNVRGLEGSVQITVDGEPLRGSFVNITSFTLTPEGEIVKKSFIGRKRKRADNRVDGYAGNMEIEEQDGRAFRLWKELAERDKLGLAPPKIGLTFFKKYRSSAEGSQTIRLREVTLRLTSHGAASREDYVKSSWEFFAEDAQ